MYFLVKTRLVGAVWMSLPPRTARIIPGTMYKLQRHAYCGPLPPARSFQNLSYSTTTWVPNIHYMSIQKTFHSETVTKRLIVLILLGGSI